jgi:uncharacterized cupin superfamily protein
MSIRQPRPDFIRHWTELEGADDAAYQNSTELLSIGAPIGKALGLTRIGIHHERLPPGRRTSYPHAESAEEEFVYVIEGTPDAWIDGRLYRLREGDAVGFPAGTGLCHSFLNNSDREVRLLVVGEKAKPENRIYYPCNPEQKSLRQDWWDDVPPRPMGQHDGMPDRGKRNSPVETGRLACILNWRGSEDPADQYPGDDELMVIGVPFSDRFGITRLGIHHGRLPPGRRTCYPHAESLEDEFVFVLEGAPDAWIDGHLHRLREGDAVAFPAGTGICHTFINNSDQDARMMVIGQRNVPGNRNWYPHNPDRKPLKENWWDDAPKRLLGPHDGKPDAKLAGKR